MAKVTYDFEDELRIDAVDIAEEMIGKFEKAVVEFASTVINKSPIGIEDSEGNYQANWQIASKENDNVLDGRFKAGVAYSKSKLEGKYKYGKDITMYLFNNSPQANVIEYGGYKKNPKQGTWNKYKKAYEIRSLSGFSKQAPQGHVRINLQKLNEKLRVLAQ